MTFLFLRHHVLLAIRERGVWDCPGALLSPLPSPCVLPPASLSPSSAASRPASQPLSPPGCLTPHTSTPDLAFSCLPAGLLPEISDRQADQAERRWRPRSAFPPHPRRQPSAIRFKAKGSSSNQNLPSPAIYPCRRVGMVSLLTSDGRPPSSRRARRRGLTMVG